MTRAEQKERTVAIAKAAPEHTVQELCKIFQYSYAGVRRILKFHGVKAKDGRCRQAPSWHAACVEAAKTHSYAELQQMFPDKSLGHIVHIVNTKGNGIGMRANVRIGTNVQHKQLDILADLRAHPDDTFKAIGMRHGVCREKVSQIAVYARNLGLLPPARPQETSV